MFLDYKRVRDRLPQENWLTMTERNLSKAISGFCNSKEDWLFGVDCRQTNQGDVPTVNPNFNSIAIQDLLERRLAD